MLARLGRGTYILIPLLRISCHSHVDQYPDTYCPHGILGMFDSVPEHTVNGVNRTHNLPDPIMALETTQPQRDGLG